MIVWGGGLLNTGGRYNPVTDTWTATSSTNVPEGRSGHTAVRDGSEMIVWGGLDNTFLNTGARLQSYYRQLDSHQHEQRARCASLTHDNLDRQRNDRLGRLLCYCRLG